MRLVSELVEEIVGLEGSSRLAATVATVAAVVVIEIGRLLASTCSHHRQSDEAGVAPFVVEPISEVMPLATVCSAGTALVVIQGTSTAPFARVPSWLEDVLREGYPARAAVADLVRQRPSDLEIACIVVAGTVVHEPACTLVVPCRLQYPTHHIRSEHNRTDRFGLLQWK